MSWQGFVDGFKRFFGFGKKEKTETTTERPNPVLEVAHAIKNADAVVSAPSYLGLGTPGLPALSREIVTSTLTPGQLEGIGHVAQNVAAKAAIGAKKIGLAKVAAKLAIVGTKSAVAVGTAVATVGVCVAIVAGVWLLSRLVRKIWSAPLAIGDCGKATHIMGECLVTT